MFLDINFSSRLNKEEERNSANQKVRNTQISSCADMQFGISGWTDTSGIFKKHTNQPISSHQFNKMNKLQAGIFHDAQGCATRYERCLQFMTNSQISINDGI